MPVGMRDYLCVFFGKVYFDTNFENDITVFKNL